MLRPRPTTTVLAAAAGLGGIGALAADEPPPPPPQPEPPAVPQPQPAHELAERAASRLAVAARRRREQRSGFTIVRVRRDARIALRARPGGRVVGRVDGRTEFGSPQTLTVAERRGRWLGVTTSKRSNGRIAWVDGRGRGVQKRRTRVSLRVDLSRHRLELRRGRLWRSVRVGIGAAGSATPTGRFAVTDKLAGAGYSRAYGCCILALSGKQEHPPRGWRGGNRLAIHGTAGRSGSFTGSAGCLRADRRALRMLMRQVPLGAPVFVHR